MKLTYQTASATLIQFLIMTVLGMINCISSIITTCNSHSSSCSSNMISSIVLFILSVGWFGLILAFGYFAQKLRSHRFAAFLIFTELITVVVAGHFNFPRESGLLTKSTSLFDVLIGLVVIYLAIQVLLARGHRIVKKRRRRSL